MHKYIIFLLLIITCLHAQLKVLHLSFHTGCIKDFEYVGRQLNLDLTSWHIPSGSRSTYDGKEQMGNDIFDIGHKRAARIWELNKDYFNTFDVIVTSDTAPLARIFLQNGWNKPLIIWICNRFDYKDGGPQDELFPDPEFYTLFRNGLDQKNVFFINYTAYEHFYAHERRVNTGNLIIKPCGVQNSIDDQNKSYIPETIDKQNTFFIPPREGSAYLRGQCVNLGIPVYTGPYNGPYDIKDFKGIIHWPYAWSNFALFENMQLGLVYFVPSANLLRKWFFDPIEGSWYPFSSLDIELLELSEWYCLDHKDIIIYFDSWQDLKYKVETTDFVAMRKKVKDFGAAHNKEMIRRWKWVFDSACAYALNS